MVSNGTDAVVDSVRVEAAAVGDTTVGVDADVDIVLGRGANTADCVEPATVTAAAVSSAVKTALTSGSGLAGTKVGGTRRIDWDDKRA